MAVYLFTNYKWLELVISMGSYIPQMGLQVLIIGITRAGHNCMMNPKFWVTIFSDKAEGQAVKALGPTKLWIDCWIGSVSEPLGDAFFAAKTWQFYR